MINPTEVIEMTTTAYVSQFVYGVSKYYNSDFFVSEVRLKIMFQNKYVKKDYQSAIHPFKVVVIK